MSHELKKTHVFTEPTTKEITEEKIRQGSHIVERAYVMAQSIVKNYWSVAETAGSADEVPPHYNSAADIIHTFKKFELYDMSDIHENNQKLIAMIDVVHLAHNCSYQVCNTHEGLEEYSGFAIEVLALLNAYHCIGDAVIHQPNNTKTKH